MREVCKKEYGFDATARKVGKTLYASIAPQNLVSADLGLDKETVERLYNALLTVTRVALSTDADVEYLAVDAKDVNTGVAITLLRRVSDVKLYFFMRISRGDFEKRGVMEIADAADAAPAGHDITREEFMARLVASRVQQKITYNPLVSVFVRVHRVRGAFADGVLTVRLEKYQRLGARAREKPVDASDGLLRRAVAEDAGDVVFKYDDREKSVRTLRVVDGTGAPLFELTREELLKARESLTAAKGLFNGEE